MPKTPSNQKVVCQNCDTSFKGNYCPECGQQLREFQKPFRFLIVDLAGNIFSFDTRLWAFYKITDSQTRLIYFGIYQWSPNAFCAAFEALRLYQFYVFLIVIHLCQSRN